MTDIQIPNAFAEALAETIEGLDITQSKLSLKLGIPAPHLSEMKKGRRSCTAEYDLRLSRYFGTTRGYWLRLQMAYHLRVAEAKKGSIIEKEVTPL